MEPRAANCIREYIKKFDRGQLIGISEIADYCKIIEGEIYVSLVHLQSSGEVKVIKRYFCPDFHQINLCEKESYCESCDLNYSNNQLEVAIYIQPQLSSRKA